MKTKATLMMMAATLAPLPLSAADEAVPAAQNFAVLAADVDAAAVAVSQRAEKLPAGALLPSDVEFAYVFPNAQDFLGFMDPELAEDADFVDCMALGLGQGSAESIFATLMYVSTFMQDADAISPFQAAQLSRVVQAISVHPVYLVLTPKAGHETELKGAMGMAMLEIASGASEIPGAEPVSINGLAGVKIDGAALARELAAEGLTADFRVNVLARELRQRTFFVLMGMKGDAGVFVLCENPEEVHFAANAKESVLATPAWDNVDAYLDKHLYMTFSASFAETLKAKGQDPALAREPAFAVSWGTPGHIHMTMKNDAHGESYLPGKLLHVDKADASGNAIYYESTGLTGTAATEFDPQAFEAGFMAGLQISANLQSDDEYESAAIVEFLSMFLPEARQMMEGCIEMGEGLTPGCTFVLDTEGALPAGFDVPAGTTVPRVSFYSGITDRSKLVSGWNVIHQAIFSGMDKLELEPEDLVISSTSSGSLHTHYLNVDGITPDIGVSVVLNDSAMAVGTSTKLNKDMVGSATGTMDFAGAVFSVDFPQLSKACRDFASLTTEDGIRNEEFDTLADLFDELAEDVEKVQGTTTIRGNMRTLNIDVQLKK